MIDLRNHKWNYKKVKEIVFCMLCCGIIVFVCVKHSYEKSGVNVSQFSEIEEMEVKNVQVISARKNKADNFEKQFEKYEQLQVELGITLIDSILAMNNSKMLIDYESDHKNWIIVDITGFIMGDVNHLEKIDGKNIYAYVPDVIYDEPIDMKIDIVTSKAQMEAGWELEYLGCYEYEKLYITEHGTKVIIIVDTSYNDMRRSKRKAVFVYDGIRYTLTGEVELQIMESIIESFGI